MTRTTRLFCTELCTTGPSSTTRIPEIRSSTPTGTSLRNWAPVPNPSLAMCTPGVREPAAASCAVTRIAGSGVRSAEMVRVPEPSSPNAGCHQKAATPSGSVRATAVAPAPVSSSGRRGPVAGATRPAGTRLRADPR